MSEPTINLSFAELAFLMALSGDDFAREACRLLGAPVVAMDDPIAQSGIASLALRELAVLNDGTLALVPELAAVALGLRTARNTASVATALADSVTPLQLFVGDEQPLAVRPLAFGCFHFDALDTGCTIADLIAAIAAEPSEPRTVVAKFDGQHTLELAVADGHAELVVDSGDSFSFAAANVEDNVRAAIDALNLDERSRIGQ